MTARVVIADGTPFVRLAVRAALLADGLRVAGEVATAADAVAAAEREQPDVVLIDWALDPEARAVEAICAAVPGVSVIVLAPDDSPPAALAAVRAGACGFLPKDTPPDRLPAVVRGAAAGEAVIPRRVVRTLLVELRRPARRRAGDERGLTPRECEVLRLVAAGLDDRSIGERLQVSEITVRRHASTAMQKLKASSRHEAVVLMSRVA